MTFGLSLNFLVILLAMLASGTLIFVALFFASGVALYFLAEFPLARILPILKSVVWTNVTSYSVASVPLFILMGEILFRTDLSVRLFRGLLPFVYHMPGRLVHTNVLGCTLFAAVSGSSIATTATIGRITIGELQKRGYDTNLSIGSLVGSGGLGMMLPPSIMMIIYGVLGNVSIAKLFMAGIVPGFLLVALNMGYIMLYSLLRPQAIPNDGEREGRFTIRDYGYALIDLLPIAFLIVFVLGSIYSGFVTPSEAATVGVVGALAIAAFFKQLTLKMLVDAMRGTILTSCLVLTLVASASFLGAALSFMHIPIAVADFIGSLELSPAELILVLFIFYVGLGMFVDGMSMIVITLPITLPLVVAAGLDPIWFGIFLVIVCELGVITPPVGFNLFVAQSLTGYDLSRVAWASMPFFFTMTLSAVILSVFPELVLWLPSLMD